ncbi:hypothetical protein K8O92_10050 [Nocardia asteroides]|nr:hypothetical protein K8O92_10050 [Nocardia asteroides]
MDSPETGDSGGLIDLLAGLDDNTAKQLIVQSRQRRAESVRRQAVDSLAELFDRTEQATREFAAELEQGKENNR